MVFYGLTKTNLVTRYFFYDDFDSCIILHIKIGKKCVQCVPLNVIVLKRPNDLLNLHFKLLVMQKILFDTNAFFTF